MLRQWDGSTYSLAELTSTSHTQQCSKTTKLFLDENGTEKTTYCSQKVAAAAAEAEEEIVTIWRNIILSYRWLLSSAPATGK